MDNGILQQLKLFFGKYKYWIVLVLFLLVILVVSDNSIVKRVVQKREIRNLQEQLKESGVDPAFLDSYIANNPVIRQAQQVLAHQQNQQLIGQINAELAEIQKLDPSIKDLNDLSEEVAYVQSTGGAINLLNAYKILNFGKVSEGKQAALKQAAINQAKGKQHLAPVNGVATPDEGVEIPSDVLSMWKETFPDKSNAELKKLYNKTL